MTARRQVPGIEPRVIHVRRLTAREMAGLIDAGMDDMHGLIRLAQLSAVDGEGKRIWDSEEAAGDEEWTVIKAVADTAMAANGLEDPGPGNG